MEKYFFGPPRMDVMFGREKYDSYQEHKEFEHHWDNLAMLDIREGQRSRPSRQMGATIGPV